MMPKVGDIRVSWRFIRASRTLTVLAQQIETYNEKKGRHEFTFRNWNPHKLNIEEDNSPEPFTTFPWICFTCNFTEKFFPYIFPEVIQEAKFDTHSG